MKNRLSMTVAACAFLAIAAGAGTKIRSFAPVGNGLSENADCDGMAMLKFDSRNGLTDVHVVLHGFLPNTVYGIKLESDGGGFTDPIAVETNNGGNANYMTNLPQDRTSNPVVTVFIWDGDIDAIDTVSADERRAVGALP